MVNRAEHADSAPAGVRVLVAVAWVGLAVYAVAASAGVLAPARFAGVVRVVSLVEFLVACMVFSLAYVVAVARSTKAEVTVAGAFFLSGDVVTRAVRLQLYSLVSLHAALALVTSTIRIYTPVAFGILSVLWGFGWMALVGSAHGRFPPRHEAVGRPGSESSAPVSTRNVPGSERNAEESGGREDEGR
ncbi:MAG: hypothetical protein KatS3mg008_0037 [Acidimicrobiales bacterium]|nr:MAG: hypothetical protein KatS3mg008_0037 [Acidimicrobiales bacterium]